MGIKSLSDFLRTNYSELYEPIHISEFQYKKIAVDTSLFMCHFKATYGDTWLKGFVQLVLSLRKNFVHPVFVYDTKAPIEKQKEKEERREQRQKTEDRVCSLESSLEKYEEHGIVDSTLREFADKRKIQNISLLTGASVLNISEVKHSIEKMRTQLFTISPADYELTRMLFKVMDIPYLSAEMEAETLCVDLCKQGKVDAVLTDDTDVLAYGTPTFLTKYSLDGVCFRIRQDKLLEALKLTEEQFLDFCILCGTDYNKNIFRVGPAKAYALIRQHGSIEKIQESGVDVAVLNHVRVREIFRDYPRTTELVRFCGEINEDEFEKFLYLHRVYGVESIRAYRTPITEMK